VRGLRNTRHIDIQLDGQPMLRRQLVQRGLLRHPL
jgi:hypothetical protein